MTETYNSNVDYFDFSRIEDHIRVWDFEFRFRLRRIIYLEFDICVLEFPRQNGISASLQPACLPGGFIQVGIYPDTLPTPAF